MTTSFRHPQQSVSIRAMPEGFLPSFETQESEQEGKTGAKLNFKFVILVDHQSNSLFFICTTPQTCMSPARPCPPAASDPAATHMSTQWNLVHIPVKNVSGDSSSSQFNESWPSSSELVGPSPAGESGGRQGDTLATYVGTVWMSVYQPHVYCIQTCIALSPGRSPLP